MFLYHYSENIHSTLLSKAAAGVISPAEATSLRNASKAKGNGGYTYCDHISFFFDPIPSSLLPKVFENEHPFWYRGHKLFEHIVAVKSLPIDIIYHVVESENKTQLLDKFSLENNWVDDNPALLKEWKLLENKVAIDLGEKGRGRTNLEKQILINVGRTADFYKAFASHPDFEFGKKKYAANVPHVMLYPPKGSIEVREIKSLTIGNDRRNNLVNLS